MPDHAAPHYRWIRLVALVALWLTLGCSGCSGPEAEPDGVTPAPTTRYPTVVPLVSSPVGPQVLARIGDRTLSLVVSTTIPAALRLTPAAVARCPVRWLNRTVSWTDASGEPRDHEAFVAPRLRIGDVEYHEVYGHVAAPDDPLLAVPTDPSADGIIGLDLLTRPPVLLDLPRQLMRIGGPESAEAVPGAPRPATGPLDDPRKTGWVAVPLAGGTDVPTFHARLDDREVRLVLSTQVRSMLWTGAGDDGDQPPDRPTHVARMELGGQQCGAFTFAPRDGPPPVIDADGFLGADFIAAHAVVLDLWRDTIWLEVRRTSWTIPVRRATDGAFRPVDGVPMPAGLTTLDDVQTALREAAPAVVLDGPGRRVVLAASPSFLPADYRVEEWTAIPLEWHRRPMTSPLRIDGTDRLVAWSASEPSASLEPAPGPDGHRLASREGVAFGTARFRQRLPDPVPADARLGADWLWTRAVLFDFRQRLVRIAPRPGDDE